MSETKPDYVYEAKRVAKGVDPFENFENDARNSMGSREKFACRVDGKRFRHRQERSHVCRILKSIYISDLSLRKIR